MFATTIALVAVVGASLVRFPFGDSLASLPATRTRPVSSTTLVGTIASPPPATPSPAPAPTHDIEIVTRPSGARVEITPVDGAIPTMTGRSPLTASVGEGRSDVRLTLDGHETRTEQVEVTRYRRLKWWLEPEGPLHRK